MAGLLQIICIRSIFLAGWPEQTLADFAKPVWSFLSSVLFSYEVNTVYFQRS